MNPPLKWAGGKRWLVPELREIWEPHSHRRLVDPFVGGGSIPFGLNPKTALLADKNHHLMNFYRWVKAGLFITEYLENTEAAYYANRERFNFLGRGGWCWEREAAVLFYYLNRTTYNGLCRFNQLWEFNAPKGKYKKINYTFDFRPFAVHMSDWDLQWSHFSDLRVLPDDFIYADPPYDGSYDGYTPEGFSWDDHVALANWLAQHPGPVVASNSYNQRTVQLYESRGFFVEPIQGPRTISCEVEGRVPTWEILAYKNI